MTNQIKTLILLAALSAIIIALGGWIGGQTGIIVALVVALLMNIGSYWYSDKIVLSMYRAREVTRADNPGLYNMVAELAQAANVPMPRIYIIPQESPNAFATGRNPEHSAVAVTQGILRLLGPDELRGVLAHEMSHIANRDILIQTVASVLASAITAIANLLQYATFFLGRGSDENGGYNPLAGLVMAILAPIAAALIQMAISRSREYLADESGARISGQPLALASALGKLESYSKQIPMRASGTTEDMFIISPLLGGGLSKLFSTHPPTAERIARLQKMARTS